MKRLVVYGYYGYGNFGDDLFVIISRDICINYLGIEPIYIGRNLSFVHPYNINVKSRIFRLYYLIKNLIKYKNILFFGGGLGINDTTFLSLLLLFRVNAYAIGVSAESKKNNLFLRLVRKFSLRRFRVIGLRDYGSINFLRELTLINKLHYSFDNAIHLIERSECKDNGLLSDLIITKKDIGIDLSLVGRNIKISNETIEKILTNMILEIIRSGNNYRLIFFSLDINVNPSDFVESINDINLIESEYSIVNYSLNPEETILLLRRMDFCISSKLHCGIVNYIYDIPNMFHSTQFVGDKLEKAIKYFIDA